MKNATDWAHEVPEHFIGDCNDLGLFAGLFAKCQADARRAGEEEGRRAALEEAASAIAEGASGGPVVGYSAYANLNMALYQAHQQLATVRAEARRAALEEVRLAMLDLTANVDYGQPCDPRFDVLCERILSVLSIRGQSVIKDTPRPPPPECERCGNVGVFDETGRWICPTCRR